MGDVIDYIGFIDREEFDDNTSDAKQQKRLIKVTLYRDYYKEIISIPIDELVKIGFFVRGGDSLFGEGDISLIPTAHHFNNEEEEENEKLDNGGGGDRDCYGKSMKRRKQQQQWRFNRRRMISTAQISEIINTGKRLSSGGHENMLWGVLKNTTSFHSYYSSFLHGNPNNSLRNYKNIWTGFHLVIHSGDGDGGDRIEAATAAAAEDRRINSLNRVCVKNKMGENVFNVYNSCKMGVLINTNFDFILFMFYHSKNLFAPPMAINHMPILNFNWFLYFLDLERVSPLEILRNYLLQNKALSSRVILTSINYFIDYLKCEYFTPLNYGFEKMIFSEMGCKRAVEKAYQKMLLFHQQLVNEGNNDEGGGGEEGAANSEGYEEEEWEREYNDGDVYNRERKTSMREKRKYSRFDLFKKGFCEKHARKQQHQQQQRSNPVIFLNRCPACFFEIFDAQLLVGNFQLYKKNIKEETEEEGEEKTNPSSSSSKNRIKDMFERLKRIKERMIRNKMKKLIEATNPRWNNVDSILSFISRSMVFFYKDRTCDYTSYLNFLLMRLINFRNDDDEREGRKCFKKSIYHHLNPFGKMLMLDMLNSTIVKEPSNVRDGRIVCNYDSSKAEDGGEEDEDRYWSFSTTNTHMFRKFQIYRWVYNEQNLLPFNMNNVRRIPLCREEDIAATAESYIAHAKIYIKNKINPLTYFEDLFVFRERYNNKNFKFEGKLIKVEHRIRDKLIAIDIVDYFSTKNEFGINYDVTLNNILGLENANIRTGNRLLGIFSNDERIPQSVRGKKILCFVRNEEQECLLKNQSKLMASFFDTETTGLDALVERMYSLAVCFRPVFGKDIEYIVIFAVSPSLTMERATSSSSPRPLRERIAGKLLELFSQKKSLYGKVKKWDCHIFQSETEMLNAVDDYFYSNFHMLTYLVGFNVTFDLSFLLVRMIINNVDSKIFQLQKLKRVEKLDILKAYQASKSIIFKSSGSGSSAEKKENEEGSGRGGFYNPNEKNYDRFLQILRALLIPEICFFDMQKMVRLKFDKLSSYNLNSCVENVCGKAQTDIEQKMIIDVQDLLNYFRDGDDDGGDVGEKKLEKAAYIHVYCVHDAALVSLLESSLSTVTEQALMGQLTGKTFDTLIGWASKSSKIVQACFEHDVKRKKENLVSVSGYFDKHNNRDCSTKGGLVITPIQMSISDYGIITLDFASLYPSIMITNNCCPSTFVFHSQVVRAIDTLKQQRRRDAGVARGDEILDRTNNNSFEEVVDREAINVFSEYTEFCLKMTKNWIPYNVIVEKFNHEADKANGGYLGVDYFPRYSFPSSIEEKGYWREDVQVQPTGLKYFFPLLYDLADSQFEGKSELFSEIFFPLRNVVKTVWDLANLLVLLLKAAKKNPNNDDDAPHSLIFLNEIIERGASFRERGGEDDEEKTAVKNWIEALYSNEENCPLIEKFVRGLVSRCWDCGAYCRFWVCKSSLKEGCWPDLQLQLGEKRASLKKKMKDARLNEYERGLANIDQNNVKCMMNSSYGIMSGKNLKSSVNQLLSNLITGIGRRTTANIKIAANSLVDNLQNIYGDTDSTFSSVRSPYFGRRVGNAYFDVDIKLEQDVCDFIEKNIGRVLWGMKRDEDYLAGKNVMKLVPERMVLFGFLFRKKNYVLCHFKEAPQVDDVLKTIKRKCEKGEEEEERDNKNDDARPSSHHHHHYQIIRNSLYSEEEVSATGGTWRHKNIANNNTKFVAKPTKYILRLKVFHLINMFLNTNFKTKNKNYAKCLLNKRVDEEGNENISYNKKNNDKAEEEEEEIGEIEELSAEMSKAMKVYESFFQIYRKGIFCKGDINVLSMQLHYITQICFVFDVDKNRIIRNIIKSILEFREPFSKLSYYKKCSKPNFTSNIYQAMLEYNERTPQKCKLFTDLVLTVNARYANMLCGDTIRVDDDHHHHDHDGNGETRPRCSDFWLKRTLQTRKTWDEYRGIGTLSGRNILNKSAIVNIFILILDGLKVFTDTFGTMVEERIALSVGKRNFDGICFDVNIIKDTSNSNNNTINNNIDDREQLIVGGGGGGGSGLYFNRGKGVGGEGGDDEEYAPGGKKYLEEHQSCHPSKNVKPQLQYFPIFQKRKHSVHEPLLNNNNNKRFKTTNNNECSSFIERIGDHEDLESVVKELNNCCPEIAKELHFAVRLYNFFKNLCEMTKPNSAHMYCADLFCDKLHIVNIDRPRDVIIASRRQSPPSSSSSSLCFPQSSSNNNNKRVNCKEKRTTKFSSTRDRNCAISICKELKSFKISVSRLFATIVDTLKRHIRDCNIFLGTDREEIIKNIFKLCWGNPMCRDACDYLHDTHMFLVLFFIQINNSRDAYAWLEEEFRKIAKNSHVDEIQQCLRTFEFYENASLVYSAEKEEDDHRRTQQRVNQKDNRKRDLLEVFVKGKKRKNHQQSQIRRGIFPEKFVFYLTSRIIWEYFNKNR